MSERTEDILGGLERLRANEFEPEIDDDFIMSLSRQVKAQELEKLFHVLMGKNGQAAA